MVSYSTLKRVYYTPELVGSLGGARALLNATGSRSKKSKHATREWLSAQNAYTLHKGVVAKFKRRPTIVRGLGVQLQADLMDVRSHREDNDGTTFLLVAIDVFSRKLYVRPLTSKSGTIVSKALESVLAEAETISVLQTDKGKEFLNKDVSEVLKKRNVKLFTTENESIKASLVERVNRTLRARIHRHLTATGGTRYADILPGIVRSYNKTPHTSIGMTPENVSYRNQETVWNRLYGQQISGRNKRLVKKPMFSVGDHVRISRARATFERGYTIKWTREIFVVDSVDVTTTPIVYELVDLDKEPVLGTFYRQELQKVKLPSTFEVEEVLKTRGKGRDAEMLVKWRDYPPSFNSWIKKHALTQVKTNKKNKKKKKKKRQRM